MGASPSRGIPGLCFEFKNGEFPVFSVIRPEFQRLKR